MAVVKEFICMAHGAFESSEESPSCPRGCTTVRRAFLTAPGVASDRTKNIDRTLDSLAKSHGMTDISNRGGRAAKRADPNAEKRQREFNDFIKSRYGEGWGAVPKGGTLNVQTGQIEGGGPGVGGALAQYHASADNVLGEVKEALVPKPVLVRQDHEKLNVTDARPPGQ